MCVHAWMCIYKYMYIVLLLLFLFLLLVIVIITEGKDINFVFLNDKRCQEIHKGTAFESDSKYQMEILYRGKHKKQTNKNIQ